VAATISAALAGSNGMTKMGADNLTLGGSLANTLSGVTYVTEGTLTLNKTTGVNAIAGDIVINGGNLSWSQANMVADDATITLISGAIGLSNKTETIKNLFFQGGNSNLGTGSNGGALTVTDTLSATGAATLNTNSNALWSVYKTVITGNARTVLSMTGNSTTNVSQYIVGAGGLSMTGQTISLTKAPRQARRGARWC
jgi:autotransporter-associated beta strand protein